MTKIQVQVRGEPDGVPVVGQSVVVRRVSDDVSLASLATDSDGIVGYTVDGHPGPFYFHVQDIPGGDRFWASYDAMAVGPLALMDVPVALSALGDGVIRGYLNELEVAVGSGNTVTVATGGALVAGYPVINYTADTLTFTRPVTSARIDRVVVRFSGSASTTFGKAVFALLAGTEGGGAPTLTQTTTTYEVSLAQVEIPVVAPITITDERAYSGEKNDVAEIERVASFTTTDTSGEAVTDLEVSLLLPRTGTYDIIAEFSGQQVDTVGADAWTLQATYGPSLVGSVTGLLNPGQVARDSVGNLYIANDHPTNGRVHKVRASDGAVLATITGLPHATGVALDGSDNIYVVHSDDNVHKYNSSHVQQWGKTFGTALQHAATDSTHLYITDTTANTIRKRKCSDGSHVATYGSAGSGNGKLDAPWGIAYNPVTGTLFVVDAGNSRVQEFTTAGVYVRQWPISANARGCAIDATGNVLVAEYGSDLVKRYTATGTLVDSFAQPDPDGLAVTSGDVLWISNSTAGTIAKWDEAATPGGYGQVTIEIDGTPGTYSGIGLRNGAFSVVETATATGPDTILVRAFAKATADTMTIKGAVLSARAVPQR